MLLCSIADTILPKSLQWIIDLLSDPAHANRQEFVSLFSLFLSVFLLQVIGQRYWRLTLGQETHRIGATLRSSLWQRARYFSKERLDRDLTTGTLMNVATSDVAGSRLIFGWTLIGATDFVFSISLALAFMIAISPSLTLWCVIITPLFPLIAHALARKESERHVIAQETLSRLNDLCAQAISTIRMQRLTQTGRFWTEKLNTIADTYRLKRLSVVNTSLGFILVFGLPSLFAYAVLFTLGTQRVVRGDLTVGEFVAMQSYILLIQFPLAEIGFIIAEWQRGTASLKRIIEVFNEPLAAHFLPSRATSTAPKTNPVFEVSNLSFSYTDGKKQILKDLSFSLRSGERLGISGPIGTGKSTLIQILAGLEHGFQGDVRLFGQDIRCYDHDTLRALVCMVPQRPFLFADSIRNNISLEKELSDEQLWHCLELAGLADEVRAFPQQLDSPLGEWGINLSGGQKQRMTLARALSRKSSILLLDDCLSAVDTLTEERILKELDRQLKETTLVWVAHRTSTLRYCTQFLEFAR